MTAKELEQYLLQSLNMALGSMMQGETSYTNSFTCKVTEEGFYFSSPACRLYCGR